MQPRAANPRLESDLRGKTWGKWGLGRGGILPGHNAIESTIFTRGSDLDLLEIYHNSGGSPGANWRLAFIILYLASERKLFFFFKDFTHLKDRVQQQRSPGSK